MKKLYLFLAAILIAACQKEELPLSMYAADVVKVETKISFTLKVRTGEVPIYVTIHVTNTSTGLFDRQYVLETKEPLKLVFEHAAIKPGTRVYIYYRNTKTDTNVIML